VSGFIRDSLYRVSDALLQISSDKFDYNIFKVANEFKNDKFNLSVDKIYKYGEGIMKVLLADKFEKSGQEKLKEIGCEVIFEPSLTVDTLPEGISKHNPDVVVVRSTKVQKPALEAAKNLKLIVRAGAGYDTIDTAGAAARDIAVANCPGKNSIAVAELAFAHIISCDRRIPDASRDLRNGKWRKGEYQKAKGIYGRTLGVIGKGKIARALIERAKAFGMEVLVWSRSLTDEIAAEMGVKMASTMHEVAKNADVVSLHIAANSETKGIIDGKFFDTMKDGAYIINTSRGSILDYGALKKAISEKGIRAGLDVFASEPKTLEDDFSDDIINMPGVYSTPHIGASTEQAQIAVADETVRIIQMEELADAV